jgi:hypothetical protein
MTGTRDEMLPVDLLVSFGYVSNRGWLGPLLRTQQLQ